MFERGVVAVVEADAIVDGLGLVAVEVAGEDPRFAVGADVAIAGDRVHVVQGRRVFVPHTVVGEPDIDESDRLFKGEGDAVRLGDDGGAGRDAESVGGVLQARFVGEEAVGDDGDLFALGFSLRGEGGGAGAVHDLLVDGKCDRVLGVGSDPVFVSVDVEQGFVSFYFGRGEPLEVLA